MSTVQLDQVNTQNPTPWRGIGDSARVTQAANSVSAVTPSNTAPLSRGCTGIWIGGTGNVSVTMWDGSTATFTAVPAGTLLPVSPMLLNASTTATGLVALF